MKHFLITIPDDKDSLFIEMMKSAKFVEKIEAITFAGLPVTQEEAIVWARIQQRDQFADCCLSWEEIDQVIGS